LIDTTTFDWQAWPVVDDDGHWYEPSYASIYHGRADGVGGSVWVYALAHSRAGLHVEVHHHAPDGPLLRGTAVSHTAEAATLVERLRAEMVLRGVEAVKGDVEPLVTRGRLIVHGGHGRYSSDAMILDDSLAIMLCAEVWVSVGVHHLKVALVSDLGTKPLIDLVRRASPTEADVTVAGAQTMELWLSTFRHRVHVGHNRLHWPCSLPASARRFAD
jgi:hypothetical protein